MTADTRRAHAALAAMVAVFVLAAGAVAVWRLVLPHMPATRAAVLGVLR